MHYLVNPTTIRSISATLEPEVIGHQSFVSDSLQSLVQKCLILLFDTGRMVADPGAALTSLDFTDKSEEILKSTLMKERATRDSITKELQSKLAATDAEPSAIMVREKVSASDEEITITVGNFKSARSVEEDLDLEAEVKRGKTEALELLAGELQETKAKLSDNDNCLAEDSQTLVYRCLWGRDNPCNNEFAHVKVCKRLHQEKSHCS